MPLTASGSSVSQADEQAQEVGGMREVMGASAGTPPPHAGSTFHAKLSGAFREIPDATDGRPG